MIKLLRRTLIPVGALAMLLAAPLAWADSLSGSYLAANQANFDNDYEAAANYYSQAIARDPDNPYLMQNALLAFIAKGEADKSLALARRIEALEIESQLGVLVLLTEAIKTEDYGRATELFDAGKDQFSPLLEGLMQAWIHLGDGKMAAATAQFDAMTDPPALELFGQYHKALALALVGDFNGADKILQGDERGNLRLNRSSVIAHAQILSQIGKNVEAQKIVKDALRGGIDQELSELLTKLETGEPVEYDFITTPKGGAAEVYFTLATALSRDETDRYSLVYARLAQYLEPENVEVLLLVAEILREQGQYELANRAYALVPADHSMFLNAELGRSEALQDADKPGAAIEVLRGLARSHGDNATVHMSLGDALRSSSDFVQAAEAYTTAVNMIQEPTPNHWFLFYARGICFEREDRWEDAEADFRKALELSPNQPSVSNYLGYSLVEKNLKLEEAQKLIEDAVKARPEDGYITDSLGWVLYRVGKFEEAVAPMERAVEIVPNDPVINDHLGDVLWMVGRRIEADFQWRRALSFGPEENEIQRIRRKLELGLDAVLREEAAQAAPVNGN